MNSIVDSLKDIGTWIAANKEWLFSGAGLALLAGLVRWFRRPAQELDPGTKATRVASPTDAAISKAVGHNQPPTEGRLIRVANPTAAVPAPWYRQPDDRVGRIADRAMEMLREMDGQMAYVSWLQKEGVGTNLEIEEALFRLQMLGMIERFGGYPDGVSFALTHKGRGYLMR